MLQRYEFFEARPALAFEQSLECFRAFIDRIRELVPLERAYVLVVSTGHYHLAFVQYLPELDIPVYIVSVQERLIRLIKTVLHDALAMANHLYNQLKLCVQLTDKTHLVRRMFPTTESVHQLKGWVQHRYELMQELTKRKISCRPTATSAFPNLVGAEGS